MQPNNDHRSPPGALDAMCARLANVGRFLQAEQKKGTKPEETASAIKSFKLLLESMAKLSQPSNWIVTVVSRSVETGEQTSHPGAEIGPAPLEVINYLLPSIICQHQLAGADVDWEAFGFEPGNNVGGASWAVVCRYPHKLIMLACHEAPKDESAEIPR